MRDDSGLEGYGPAEIRRLWTVVSLHRDLGVNLAGVEAILRLRSHVDRLQSCLLQILEEFDEPLPPRRRPPTLSDKSPTSPDPNQPTAATDPVKRRRDRVGYATWLWAQLVLGSLLILTTLILWHLLRRGRLLREELNRPRPLSPLPEPPDEPRPDDSGRTTTNPQRPAPPPGP